MCNPKLPSWWFHYYETVISIHQLISILIHFHYFLLYILQPRRVNSSSKTLILPSMALLDIISGNFTATLSDHFPWPSIAPNIFLNSSFPWSNKYERDWLRFDQENFIFNYCSIGWDNLFLESNMNIDNLFKNFIEKFDSLLNTSEKLSKNKLKFKEQHWTTSGLQRIISIKNHYLSNFIR